MVLVEQLRNAPYLTNFRTPAEREEALLLLVGRIGISMQKSNGNGSIVALTHPHCHFARILRIEWRDD